MDGSTIKDDVEKTKKQIQSKVDSAKTQAKQIYDQATTAAVDTITTLQEQGYRFGEELQAQTSQAIASGKEKADSLVKSGTKAAKQMSSSIEQSANQALSKLEEVTGLSKEDIKRKLNEGVSVNEIVENVKSAAKSAKDAAGSQLHKADLEAGEVLQDVKNSTNDFVDQNDLKERAKDSVDYGKEKLSKDKDQVSDAMRKGFNEGQEVASKAGNAAQDLRSEGNAKAQELKQDASDVTADVKRKTDEVANTASGSQVGTGDRKATTAEDHLKAVGIVHTDSPDERISVSNADPAYMDDSLARTPSDSASSHKQIQDQRSALVQQVIAQIKAKVKDVQGISKDDLRAAANDLINKTTESTEALADFVNDASADIQQKSGEYRDKAVDQGKDLIDSASESAAQGKKKGGEVAAQAKESGEEAVSVAKGKTAETVEAGRGKTEEFKESFNDAAQKASSEGKAMADTAQSQIADIRKRLENIDPQELQATVDDLLRTTKRKLEETTGVKEEDVQHSLEWAIQQGEELARKAMENGKDGLQSARETSRDAASYVKDKSVAIGKETEKTVVAVGAQTKRTLQNARRDAPGQIHETLDASQEFVDTAIAAVKDSTADIREYLAEKFPPKRRTAIRKHFQGLAVALRDNTDYSNGLDGLISIARKYIDYTLTFTEELPSDASDVVSTNEELDRAVSSTLKLIERFSNGVGFSGVQKSYGKLKKDMQKEKGSEDFLNDCMTYFKRIVQDMKYASSDDAEKHGQQLLQRIDTFTVDSGFKQHTQELIQEVVRLAEGFASDKALFNFIHRGQILFKHLVMNEYGNFVFKKRVMKDFLNIIVPSTLKLVQYIPISRVEFQNADVDVLIENLVFESSSNHDQSFLPYRFKLDNHNTLEFLNAYKLESDYSNQVTVKVEGLTMAVRDAGFYIRKKTGFWRFVDSGLLDLVMDGKGIDIDIDLQMSTDDEDADVTKDALFIVKDVRVNIHKLDFSTSGTRHGWLVGLVKPFIRGFVKRQVGLAIGEAMKEQLEYYEYQLRMLQHRIKTAYIANNGQASFESFFRAVFTANAGNNPGRKGQFEIAVGKPGPLAGIFTKASLQQELEESDTIAAEHGRPHSWRNGIFDLGV